MTNYALMDLIHQAEHPAPVRFGSRLSHLLYSCMRIAFAIVVISALWIGCRSRPALPHVIWVGMPLYEGERILQAKQANNITEKVGIVITGVPSDAVAIDDFRLHWYILPDKTCVCFTSGRLRGRAASTILTITLGEKGKGYHDKIEWLKQSSVDVQQLDL